MNCSAGHQNVEGAAFCASCGLAMATAPPGAPVPWPPATVPPTPWTTPQTPTPWTTPQTTTASWPALPPAVGYGQYPSLQRPQNGMGTAALILGILGLLLFGCIFGVLAVIFGSIGISRANAGRANNKGVAVAGLILGIVGIVAWSLIILASAGG